MVNDECNNTINVAMKIVLEWMNQFVGLSIFVHWHGSTWLISDWTCFDWYIVQVSSSHVDSSSDWPVSDVVWDETIVSTTEQGASIALVASTLHTLGSSEILQIWWHAHPAADAEPSTAAAHDGTTMVLPAQIKAS